LPNIYQVVDLKTHVKGRLFIICLNAATNRFLYIRSSELGRYSRVVRYKKEIN